MARVYIDVTIAPPGYIHEPLTLAYYSEESAELGMWAVWIAWQERSDTGEQWLEIGVSGDLIERQAQRVSEGDARLCFRRAVAWAVSGIRPQELLNYIDLDP